jgi:hypothetical protein
MSDNDERVAIRNAILTNTGVKILFGGLEPDDAELMARLLFTGHLALAEWKPGSERPVAVGSDKTKVANWSRADTEGRSEMLAHSQTRSRGSARGTIHTTSTASGTATATGESSGMVLTPTATLFGPNAPNATLIPVPLSQSSGQSSSGNTFDQTSESTGETYTEIESESAGTTTARADTRSISHSKGESEAFITRYEWLPSTMYSLQEQIHRAVGELMNLSPREVFVKIRGNAPFRARTADVPATFRSAAFKKIMLPHYRARSLALSPYIRSADVVDAELACRLAPELPKPTKAEPNWLDPEPFDLAYPDPPPPPDAARAKPKLRVIKPETNSGG